MAVKWRINLYNRNAKFASAEFDTLDAGIMWSLGRESRYNIDIIARDPFGDNAFVLELKHCADGSLLEHVIGSLWTPIKRVDIPAWCERYERIMAGKREMTHYIVAYICSATDHTVTDARILRCLHHEGMTWEDAQGILDNFSHANHYLVPDGEEHILHMVDCSTGMPVLDPSGDPVSAWIFYYPELNEEI